MNQTHQEAWVQHAPYTAMLLQYRKAAERIQTRLCVLRGELKDAAAHKQYTAASADLQRSLERRMDLLRTEYYEITDCMRKIGCYAEMEQV